MLGHWYVWEQKKMWGQGGTTAKLCPSLHQQKEVWILLASFSSWKNSFFFLRQKFLSLRGRSSTCGSCGCMELSLFIWASGNILSILDTYRHLIWLISSLEHHIRNYWRESVQSKTREHVFSNAMIFSILHNNRTEEKMSDEISGVLLVEAKLLCISKWLVNMFCVMESSRSQFDGEGGWWHFCCGHPPSLSPGVVYGSHRELCLSLTQNSSTRDPEASQNLWLCSELP